MTLAVCNDPAHVQNVVFVISLENVQSEFAQLLDKIVLLVGIALRILLEDSDDLASTEYRQLPISTLRSRSCGITSRVQRSHVSHRLCSSLNLLVVLDANSPSALWLTF